MKTDLGGEVEPQGQKSFTAHQSFPKNFDTHGEKEEQDGLYFNQKTGGVGKVAGRFSGWSGK